jgi:hypothetical protein
MSTFGQMLSLTAPHSQPMRSALRRGLFFSLLLALTLPLTSCDSGGPNESPEWAGTWKLSEASGWSKWLGGHPSPVL